MHINIVSWQCDCFAVTVDFPLNSGPFRSGICAISNITFAVMISCLHLNRVFHVIYNLFSSN